MQILAGHNLHEMSNVSSEAENLWFCGLLIWQTDRVNEWIEVTSEEERPGFYSHLLWQLRKQIPEFISFNILIFLHILICTCVFFTLNYIELLFLSNIEYNY